ncbi:unnamed protein product [Parnassius mnemosyne]|uniref:Uncharacterized protein n=1 Tax=Parnassius mnemosyne TaxID=213953 RepID=A0AAV1L3U6_9NEOP
MTVELEYDYDAATANMDTFSQNDIDFLQQWAQKLDKSKYVPKDLTNKQLLLFYSACYGDIDKTKTCIEKYYRFRRSSPEFFDDRYLYSEELKISTKVIPCDSSNSEDESDIENENENGFVIKADPRGVIPKLVYKELITKVRKKVKFLKGSPTRMDILNSYLESKSKDTTLIDCKTRWSTLADMIARVLEFKDAIQKILIDPKEKTQKSENQTY